MIKDENEADFLEEDLNADLEDNQDVEEDQTPETELEKLKRESKENFDGWQRALADYANLQKQTSKDKENLKKYIIAGFVEDLLPVLDSFDMAMKNKEAWEKVEENWRKGIEYILQSFNQALESHLVTRIEVKEGDNFDPKLHEPMDNTETENESDDGKVSEIVQAGYKVDDTLIRPAKVKVYNFNK
jgi:molecular chaperone GrpE